jgi:hypothetical protein
MRSDPYRRLDRMGWAGVVRLLSVLFLVSLALTVGLFASVRLGVVDRGTFERHRAVDWRDVQGAAADAAGPAGD